LDPESALLNPRAGAIGSAHVGKLLTLFAVVVRTGAVQMFAAYRIYACAACKREFRIATDVTDPGAATRPEACPTHGCTSAKFKQLEGGHVHSNYQEIHVQVVRG